METNILGLNIAKSNETAASLNLLLSSFQTYYQNLRGIHWNIKGKQFFELHIKFEALYTEANMKIDEIAERILTLGGVPFHTFEDYTKLSAVAVGKNITKDEEAVMLIVNSLSSLLKHERHILELAGDANDEGTNSLMSELISEQEKTIWMMRSWLA